MRHRPRVTAKKIARVRDRTTREEVIEKYRNYLLSNPRLLSDLHELKGKVLGCWCKPLACHGDVIIEILQFKA